MILNEEKKRRYLSDETLADHCGDGARTFCHCRACAGGQHLGVETIRHISVEGEGLVLAVVSGVRSRALSCRRARCA